MKSSELLDEWVFLRDAGESIETAAKSLEMKPGSLLKALERAREKGDPRAEWSGKRDPSGTLHLKVAIPRHRRRRN